MYKLYIYLIHWESFSSIGYSWEVKNNGFYKTFILDLNSIVSRVSEKCCIFSARSKLVERYYAIGKVGHTCNPSAKVRKEVREASLGYTVGSFLKKIVKHTNTKYSGLVAHSKFLIFLNIIRSVCVSVSDCSPIWKDYWREMEITHRWFIHLI